MIERINNLSLQASQSQPASAPNPAQPPNGSLPNIIQAVRNALEFSAASDRSAGKYVFKPLSDIQPANWKNWANNHGLVASPGRRKF